MRIKTLSIIIIVAFILSCNDAHKDQINADSQQEVINETPQVLDENADYKLGSISKRSDSDIILKLYNEAVEKNSKLSQLNDAIKEMPQIKNDSLDKYSKFSQTNNNYWLTANRYINQLQDSILKESSLEIFKALEAKYEAKMSDYEQKLTTINEKTTSLNDQLILMKLFITEPMIKNYEINEKPSIKTLENIINEYDKLLKETEEYTKIVK